MLIAETVHIWREPDGDYQIEWQVSHPETQVTVEPLVETGALRIQYHTNPAAGARLGGLNPASRHFFRLRDQHGTQVVTTERKLGMQGTPNFRDFGGYPGADGRRVKWGYLFRSGQLSALSEQDVKLVGSLGLDLICDFRKVEEQQSDRSRLPLPQPRVVSLPIVPGSNSRSLEQAGTIGVDAAAMFDFMLEINREFAVSQTRTYGRMFREILSVNNARILVHCAAGKDRTGFAAAIILLALGVSRDAVMQDYMLTGRYFRPELELERVRRKYGMESSATESIIPVLEVHERYLEQALDTIVESCGSVEQYLEHALGVGPAELATLRERYLE